MGQRDGHEGRHAGRGERGREGMSGTAIVLLVASALLVIFIVQNLTTTTITFLFWKFDMKVWVALLLAAVLGFVVGYLVSNVRRTRKLEERAMRGVKD